ncbi:Mur ligase family protein [Patescibacteria group bacterium]|nr:Mur ligase family protein [Patescibacteria group bacterium]
MRTLYSAYHWLWAFLGALRFGFPSRHITVIGVTGTKGKSTTVELIAEALMANGHKVAFLTSVWRMVGGSRAKNLSGNSMPGRGSIQSFLNSARQAGCAYAVIEVTSQGVAQHRHLFIDWDAAVFLNLAPEHIESHGSFENYRAAKVAFFSSLRHSSKKTRLFFVNRKDPNSPWFIRSAERVPGGRITEFDGYAPLKNPWFRSDFNRENAGAAAAVAEAFGVPAETVRRAFEDFGGVPGRMEFVQKDPFAVVVDYAHTPDSLEAIYRSVRPEEIFGRPGRLIAVLGSAGGGRDKWKRPKMGAVAARYCDALVLTSEDPFDEDDREIIKELRSGFADAQTPRLRPENTFEVLDRREAIRRAVGLARPGDTVVLTGKGSESYIRVASGNKVPWSEKDVVAGFLNKK